MNFTISFSPSRPPPPPGPRLPSPKGRPRLGAVTDDEITFDIDADASKEDIAALVAQSQKRSAVFDALTNPTNVTVSVV